MSEPIKDVAIIAALAAASCGYEINAAPYRKIKRRRQNRYASTPQVEILPELNNRAKRRREQKAKAKATK